ncbi:hypothetical protein NRF20_03220 [Streptomyces sp. R-74717]|uniref:hypothetical protein n=1 Tax=Streptomyces TaxID=1883 RepID=UPI00379D3AC3
MRRPIWAAVLAAAVTSLSLAATPAAADGLDPTGDVDPVSSATYKKSKPVAHHRRQHEPGRRTLHLRLRRRPPRRRLVAA